jgi:hypothetical protein
MQLNLVADRIVKGKIYPNLARFSAEPYTVQWRQFDQHWPNTIPLRLQEYCQSLVTLNLYTEHWPTKSFYPIALGWFNFDIDYLSLLPVPIREAVQLGTLQLLFYYHEGDSPQRMQQRLDQLVHRWHMPTNCYVFVSSNSAADHLDRFVSFQDSELWYWHRNKTAPLPVHTHQRQREFTALSRLHKWWRAAVISDLKQLGVLANSYWSYCETNTDHDKLEDCPIELDTIDGLRDTMHSFMSKAPYFADNLSQAQRNDHSVTVEKFFTDAYCNIVLETMFDYDQSGGVLLSEKTFKPIKHGQLFFIVGAVGSLQVLRDLGYQTFDQILDNSYDKEINNTQRWIKLRAAIQKAQQQGVEKLFALARSQIEHNQALFAATKQQRLSTLIKKIYDKSS